MKKDKIIYWVTTGIISFMMLFSAYSYFTNEEIKGAFVHLGFPSYFRVELAVAKILGVTALVLPFVSTRLKEFAYAGLAITFISAMIAHLSSGDPAQVVIMPLVLLVLLAISFIYLHKVKKLQVA
jgi:DoxX-like family